MPDFTRSFSQPTEALLHFWAHTIGSGHALLGLRADWRVQTLRCHQEPGFQHIRFQAPLSDEMPRHPIQTEALNRPLSDMPAPRIAWIDRIDEDHAIPRRLWHAIGEAESLRVSQLGQLEAASALRKESQPRTEELENINLIVALAPQRVAALTIEFA